MSFVVFDLEIVNDIVKDKYGYDFKTPYDTDISVCCTYSEEDGMSDWISGEVIELMKYMNSFTRIIGFNHIAFDYHVIAGVLNKHDNTRSNEEWHTYIMETTKGKNFDILENVLMNCGHQVSLSDICRAMAFGNKIMDDAEAPKTWRARKRLEVIQYCQKDVWLTLQAYKNIISFEEIRYQKKDRDLVKTIKIPQDKWIFA